MRDLLVLLTFSLSTLAAAKPAKSLTTLLGDVLSIEQTHPDSVYPRIQRIEAYKAAAATPQERAMTALALGKLYIERSYMAQYAGHERFEQLSHANFREALAQPDMLGNMKVKDWRPLTVLGGKDNPMAEDMLYLAWQTARNSLGAQVCDTLPGIPSTGWMIRHYERQGNRRAALSIVLDSLLESTTPVLQMERELHKVRDRYQDVPDAAEVYIHLSECEGLSQDQRKAYLTEGLKRYANYKGRERLQNRLLALTDPTFQWTGPTLLYPGKAYDWQFEANNLSGVSWQEGSHAFDTTRSDVERTRDTIQWHAPLVLGKHKLWFLPQPRVKTKTKVQKLEQEMMVSRLQLLTQWLPEGQLRVLVVDRETGKPQQGVLVEQFHSDDDTLAFARQRTNALGSVIINVPRKGSYYQPVYIRLSNEEERNLGIQHLTYYRTGGYVPYNTQRRTQFYTDRSVYRPGQEVKVGGIVYEQRGWEMRTKAGDSVTLVLRDAQYKEVEQKTVATDEFGVFDATFQLPTNRRLGTWSIYLQGEYRTTLRVEHYKRPTFSVELADSLQRTPDSLTFRGTAVRFDGTPLRNARVSANSQLQSFWYRPHNTATQTYNDTVSTDANGHFSVSVPNDTTKHSLQVVLNVLASYGEQQEAKRSFTLRPYRPQPEKADSTFLVTCPRDSFDAQHPTELVLITSRPQAWVYYTLSAKGEVVMDTLLNIRQGKTALPLVYKDSYGDGLVATFATTLGEKTYTHSQEIRLARPDTRLQLRWDSFRDLTQPGAREQWKLTLTRPDGHPARANVLATVYDASLDRIQRHQLALNVMLGHWLHGIGYHNLTYPATGSLFETYLQKRKKEKLKNHDAHLDEQWFEADGPMLYETSALGTPLRMYKASRAAATMTLDAAPLAATQSESMEEAKNKSVSIRGYGKPESDTDAALPLRENFQETAYFNPRIRTNAQGQAVMEFTLPQSATTWRLKAVAHTQDLMHATFGRDIVAQKPVMAQARLPRFLRAGDQAILRGSLTNNSNKEQHVSATLQVLDAESRKAVLTRRVSLALPAQADTTLSFIYNKEDERDILVRWSVEGKEGTDGEQHRLSVLPTTEEMVNTLPITAPEAGAYQFDLKQLFPDNAQNRGLVVEYTSHPEQLALQALPALASKYRGDILSITAAYYAQVLAKGLGVEAEDSTEALLQRMRDMQHADGGIAWYPGMPSSRYMSLEVGFQLARLQMLTGKAQDGGLLTGIVRYLLNERSRVRLLWGSDVLRTLYVVQATQVKLQRGEQAKVDSLLSITKDLKPENLDLECQALAAIVLHRQGLDRKAHAMIEAFHPRLVSAPLKGTYIEHPQGPFRSIDRKLDIHVQLMEALQTLVPQSKELGGMRQHLLLQKRTQVWDTPIRSVNAIFALMHGQQKETQIARDVLQLWQQGKSVPTNIIAADNTLGYARDSMDATQLPTKLRLQKMSKGQSWGAAYATFRQPYTQADADTTGLAVRQSIPTNAQSGNRITLTQRIMADGDYEYVTVIIPRPATLEPVEQRSGLHWQDGLCYYLEVMDSELRYHILSIPRGHYRLQQDYYVERPGRYHTGISRIQCTLAPEFQGRDTDHVIEVK